MKKVQGRIIIILEKKTLPREMTSGNISQYPWVLFCKTNKKNDLSIIHKSYDIYSVINCFKS